MKRLIIYIFIFIGCFLGSNLILIYITSKSLEGPIFEIPKNKNILILGNSTLECSINDSILNNSLNLANSGEAYIYTYVKLKLFTEANSQIDTVFLSFNFKSLLQISDYQAIDNNGIQNIDRYCYFFDKSDQKAFKESVHYYKGLLRVPYTYRSSLLNYMKGKQTSYEQLNMGGYLHLDKNSLNEHLQRISQLVTQVQILPEDYNKNSFQAFYLEKIVRYCKQKNIQLIFINTPIYPGCRFGIKEYYQYYEQYYSDIPLWDYSELALPDSCYADAFHLNYKGAIYFSELIKNQK